MVDALTNKPQNFRVLTHPYKTSELIFWQDIFFHMVIKEPGLPLTMIPIFSGA